MGISTRKDANPVSIALSTIIVLANVAYSAHALRQWRRVSPAVRRVAAPQRQTYPSPMIGCETTRIVTA